MTRATTPRVSFAEKERGARRDLEARGETLDVPLERRGTGLVEIVDVEEQRPVRRRETTEVRQVGVAARLHPQPAVGRDREVGGHDHRGAAVEGERRRQHPLVAEGDEIRDAGRLLRGQERRRVGTIGPGRPLAVRGARHRGPSRPAHPCPFAGIEVDDRCPAGGRRYVMRVGHGPILSRPGAGVLTRSG